MAQALRATQGEAPHVSQGLSLSMSLLVQGPDAVSFHLALSPLDSDITSSLTSS